MCQNNQILSIVFGVYIILKFAVLFRDFGQQSEFFETIKIHFFLNNSSLLCCLHNNNIHQWNNEIKFQQIWSNTNKDLFTNYLFLHNLKYVVGLPITKINCCFFWKTTTQNKAIYLVNYRVKCFRKSIITKIIMCEYEIVIKDNLAF